MIKEYTCIVCPNGCDIEVRLDGQRIVSVEGEGCKKGIEYIEREICNPKRTITSSIEVVGGDIPLVSVRLTNPIPKERIFDVMTEIKKIKLQAPICIGQVIISDVLGLDSDLIATKHVKSTTVKY